MSSTVLRHARNLWLGNLDTDTQGACHRMISCGRNWSEGSIAKEHQVTCHYQKPEERHRTASPLEPQEGPNSADSRPPTPCGSELSSFCRVHSSCYSNRRNLMCQWARWLTAGLGGAYHTSYGSPLWQLPLHLTLPAIERVLTGQTVLGGEDSHFCLSSWGPGSSSPARPGLKEARCDSFNSPESFSREWPTC